MRRIRSAPRLLNLALVASMLAAAPGFAQEDDDILAPAEPAEVKKPVAQKARVGFVALVPVGEASRPLADQVGEGLLKELAEGDFAIETLELAAAAEGASTEDKGAEKNLAKANALLAKGRKYLATLSFGRAEATFKKAEIGFASAAPVLEDVDPLVETYLGLAETYARQALDDQAAVALKNAARLNPEKTLDPAKYPPQFIRSFGEVRSELLKGETGAIFVDGTGRGGTVFVDGRKIGPAPVKITRLPVGPHLVRVYAEGVGRYGEMVEVLDGEDAKVSPGWAKIDAVSPLDLLADNRFDDSAAAEIARVAKERGLIGAIVGVVAKGNATVPSALIYVDAASGKVRHVDVLKFDGDLLNMSIEALKAREEISKSIQKKKFSVVDDEPLIASVASTGEVKLPEVAMRYEVGAQMSTATRSDTRRRALGGDNGGDDDDGEGRKVLGSGKKKTLSLKDANRDPLAGPTHREVLTESDTPAGGGIFANPWVWTSVAVGGAVIVGVVAVGGGVVGWMLLPPTEARVEVVMPE